MTQSSSPRSAAPARRSFALSGRSRAVDPRTQAVRADLADIRLAEYVFAPHYAMAMPRRLVRDATLLAAADDGEMLAHLAAGETFDVLEVSGDTAWGKSVTSGLVGYLPLDSLEGCA